MTPSHHFPRSRWLAASAAIAALCRVLGCATIEEEPSSNTDAPSNTGLVSSSDSGSSATLTHGSTATIGSTGTTSAPSTGTSLTTSAVTTGGATPTTAQSISASSSESSTVASATASNSATGSTSAVTTGGSTTTTSSSVTGGSGGATATNSLTSATESSSTTGGGSEFCDDAQTPAQNVAAEGNTGSFGTTEGVCFRLDFAPADFAGWGCSNFAASGGNRTIVVNGTTVTCGELPLPEAVLGSYYFDFGPGTNVTAAMYWWNWQ